MLLFAADFSCLSHRRCRRYRQNFSWHRTYRLLCNWWGNTAVFCITFHHRARLSDRPKTFSLIRFDGDRLQLRDDAGVSRDISVHTWPGRWKNQVVKSVSFHHVTDPACRHALFLLVQRASLCRAAFNVSWQIRQRLHRSLCFSVPFSLVWSVQPSVVYRWNGVLVAEYWHQDASSHSRGALFGSALTLCSGFRLFSRL